MVSGTPIDITAEQKTAWDALNLTSLTGNYDPHSSASVFTVSIDASNDNPNLGLKEGSYLLKGNDTDGWSVEILDEVIM